MTENTNSDADDPIAQVTDHRGHALRNYSVEDFRTAWRAATDLDDQSEIRRTLRRMDHGRFHEMLDECHNVLAHSDIEGRQNFAETFSDNLLDWIQVFGMVENLNQFPRTVNSIDDEIHPEEDE